MNKPRRRPHLATCQRLRAKMAVSLVRAQDQLRLAQQTGTVTPYHVTLVRDRTRLYNWISARVERLTSENMTTQEPVDTSCRAG